MAKKALVRAPAIQRPGSSLDRGVNFNDTLVNLLTGMGGAQDKLRSTVFGYKQIDKSQLENAYRGDWISRKIVDIPSYDTFREWRTWDADQPDMEKIEGVEKTLKLQRKAMLCDIRARLYGGAALILGIDQGKSDDEVNYDTLGADCLKFVHVVNRYEISAGPVNWDVMSPYFGEPEYYTKSNLVNGKQVGGVLRFHPSRVVRFIGQEPTDYNLAQGWGDSVLGIVADAVLSAGLVSGSIAQMVAEAKVDIVKIPELSEQIQTKGYESKLVKRFATANAMKSAFNVTLADKEEDWERIQADFTTLPDIAKFYMLMACGAADIPATRFLGQSPAGMNATGDSDLTNYYDSRKTDQTNRVTPTMERLDKVMVISALGSYPDGIDYTWNPLWQMTDIQKADIALKKAQVMTADVNAGLITPLVLQKAREAQLINDSTYPGLADFIDEFGDNIDERTPDLGGAMEPVLGPDGKPVIDPATGLPQMQPAQPPAATSRPPLAPRRVAGGAAPADPKAGVDPTADPKTKAKAGAKGAAVKTGDMASRIRNGGVNDVMLRPKPLYVRRDVINQDAIKAWAKEQGFDTSVDDMHVTIVYSKQPIDWLKAGQDEFAYNAQDDGSMRVKPGGPRVMQLFGGGAIVLSFASSDLAYRHSSIMYRCENASWDYDDYTPHITITYKPPANFDIDSIEPYTGEIIFGPEIFEEINSGFDNASDVEES